MENVEYKKRRSKLLESLKDNSIAIIYAGVSRIKSEDANYDFDVNRNFYYLTGITQENSVLMLVNADGEKKEYLFIDEYSELKEKWTGRRITVDEARDISGINNVLLNNSLEAKIESALANGSFGEINTVYLDLSKELKIAECTSTVDYAATIHNKFHKEIENVYPLVVALRVIKSPFEINMVREAIHNTHMGLLKVMKVAKPGMYEYEVANEFAHTIMDLGTHEFAFPSIIASGKNTCCLHYPTPYDEIKPGDLLLCDVGSGYRKYSGDITRTFPVSGRYSEMQKIIYSIVLECNKAVIKMIKPGLTMKELQNFTVEFLRAECLAKGLINNPEDIKNYYFHSVSHPLGLDTHDVGGRDQILTPGMILTVEPGLYFLEKKIGVRIEDDVLVTETGSENLSIAIPKEIEDIERIFATRE